MRELIFYLSRPNVIQIIAVLERIGYLSVSYNCTFSALIVHCEPKDCRTISVFLECLNMVCLRLQAESLHCSFLRIMSSRWLLTVHHFLKFASYCHIPRTMARYIWFNMVAKINFCEESNDLFQQYDYPRDVRKSFSKLLTFPRWNFKVTLYLTGHAFNCQEDVFYQFGYYFYYFY